MHGASMELHRIPWKSMEFQRIPRSSTEFHGLPWNSMGLFYTGYTLQNNLTKNKNKK